MLKLIKKILAHLLPSKCIICSSTEKYVLDLCPACFDFLPILPQNCYQCANYVSAPHAKCFRCLNDPPSISKTFVLFVYEPPINHFIYALKFSDGIIYARIFAQLLAAKISSWYQEDTLPELIIPVPLHPRRMRERGYNQALEIAKIVAKITRIDINFQSCQRIKNTKPQALLGSKLARVKNIKNAFKITRRFKDMHIAILDDVVTTGLTAQALAQALIKQGAIRVDVWAVAKPLRQMR